MKPCCFPYVTGSDLCTARMGGLVTRTGGLSRAGSISALPSAVRFSTVCNSRASVDSGKPAGSWATLVLEQIDNMHDYYARYLPQMALAVSVPLLIVVAIFPSNWAAALILLGTAPLIPLFMALVGMGAADANRRNFLALARLSGHFLDRLRGMETLRIFGRGEAEIESIRYFIGRFPPTDNGSATTGVFILRHSQFFPSLSIALVAVYFGFSYLGELDFGHYDTGVTLAAGFLALILAPEFFQPLRDLGTFYHAKAQAVGAADGLKTFMETPLAHPQRGETDLAVQPIR
ncbi:ABC transporter transmembrane domain-containing protein [Escherichia coli]